MSSLHKTKIPQPAVLDWLVYFGPESLQDKRCQSFPVFAILARYLEGWNLKWYL